MIIKKDKIKALEGGKKERTTVSNTVDSSDEKKSDSAQIEVAENNQGVVSSETDDVIEYQVSAPSPKEPEIDLFDIENIDFNQRDERRRGTRRRGYRRIDDRNLVSRAQEEAETIKRSAYEEGYRSGLEKAAADMELFRNNVKNFLGAPKEVFEYIAPDILELSVDIAKKIIKTEVTSNPQVLMNTIIDVLKKISKNEPKISIRINPKSVDFVKDTLPNVTYEFGIEAKINIISDPSVEEGGCVFQTNNGIVDASIDTQIEIIKKAVEGA